MTISSESARQNRVLAHGLCLAGLILAAISLVLPYVDEASTTFGTVAENTIVQSEYGWVNIVLIGLCAFGLVRNVMTPHRVVWPLVVGGLTVASAVYAFVDEDQRTLCPIGDTSFSDACSVGEPGLGIYVLGAGGAALAISGLFFLRLPETTSAQASQEARDPMTVTRECPHCKSQIRPDASVCPICRRESAAWTLKEEHWWRQVDGKWLYLKPGEGWFEVKADPPAPVTSGS